MMSIFKRDEKSMRRSIATASLAFAAVAAQAEGPRAVTVADFDVAGIKLGMDVPSAIEAAGNFLHIDKGSIKFDRYSGSTPSGFVARNKTQNLTVLFNPVAPSASAGQETVISIKLAVRYTPEHLDALKSSTLEKYGEPTSGTSSKTWSWCLHPDEERDCPSGTEPVLQYWPGSLSLVDYTRFPK